MRTTSSSAPSSAGPGRRAAEAALARPPLKAAPAAALLFLVLHAAAGSVRAAGIDLNLQPLSYRSLHENDIDEVPHDTQTSFGGTVDIGTTPSHLRAAFGLFAGRGSGNFSSFSFNGEQRSTTYEFSIGMSGEWRTRNRFRGYFGGGVSMVAASIERGVEEGTDTCRGIWVEGGLAWRAGPHLSLGLGARALGGTEVHTEFASPFTVDYLQIGPLVSWTWPAGR